MNQWLDTPSAQDGNDRAPDALQRPVYAPLDLTPLAKRWHELPPPRKWLVTDWIPAGSVTALYGDGGTGKTLLAMQLGTCIGTGRRFLGLETTHGRALGIFCEDDDAELHRRQRDINQGYGLAMKAVSDNVLWYSRRGEDNLLCEFGGGDHIVFTEFYWKVRETAKLFKPTVLFIDTAADTFGGNDISTPQVRQFIQVALGGLAKEFDCTVILLAHPSLSGLNSGEGSHGSRAWNNAVRSRLYLTHEKGEDGEQSNTRVLQRKKANYAARDEEIRLFWDAGTFWPVLEDGSAARDRDELARRAFLELLEERHTKNLPTSAARNSPNCADKVFARHERNRTYKLSRRDYERAMHALLDSGDIVNMEVAKFHRMDLVPAKRRDLSA